MSTATVTAVGPAAGPELILHVRHRAELAGAVDGVRERGLGLLAVRRDDFALPTLATVLDGLAHGLEDGPGFAVMRGLGLDDWPLADLRRAMWGLGRHLGAAVSQDARGRLVTELGPGSGDGRPDTRGRLHTGGSDASMFLALEPAVVTLVDSAAVLREVVRRRPDLAARLFRPFAIDLFDEQAPGTAAYRMVPLACGYAGRLSLRWPRAAVESAQRFPEAPRLGEVERAALDLVEDVAGTAWRARTVRLEPGDVLVVNDHAVLQRHELPESRVLRMWLTLDRGRDLPTGYIWPNPSYGDSQGRGGVLPRDVIDRRPATRTAA